MERGDFGESVIFVASCSLTDMRLAAMQHRDSDE